MPRQARSTIGLVLLLSVGALGCFQASMQASGSDGGVADVGHDSINTDAATTTDAATSADVVSSPDAGEADAGLVWTFDAGPPIRGTGHCTATGWCFELPLPYGFDQSSLWAAASNDVWAATSASELLHFDGSEWKVHPVPERMWSIHGSASNNVWAISWSSIWRWNGTTWTEQPLPKRSNRWLISLAVHSSTEVWVTSSTELWRWDGSKWNLTPSPDYHIAGVVANANQVWLWPARNWPQWSETVAQWDGSTWIEQPAALSVFSLWPTTEAIWALETKDFPLAVGGRCKLARRTLPNEPWETGAEDLCGTIWSSSDSDVWRMTYQGVQRWDGRQFQPEPLRAPTPLLAMGGSSSHDVWTVGGGGYRAHFDGAKWSETRPTGLMSGAISDLSCTSAGTWAVVARHRFNSSIDEESGLILHDDGTGWRVEAKTRVALRKIYNAGGELWAVGGGAVFHRAGGWHAEDLGLHKCNSLSMTAANNGWAGCKDALLHFDGKTWSPVAGAPLGEVWGTSSTDLWVMQDAPTVLHHWNGTSWTEATPGKSSSGSLFGTPGDTWFVASSSPSQAWRWNGSGWVEAPAPRSGYRALPLGPDDIWTLDGAALEHWDGTRWSREEPIGFPGSAFCIAPDGHFKVATGNYAVGILRR